MKSRTTKMVLMGVAGGIRFVVVVNIFPVPDFEHLATPGTLSLVGMILLGLALVLAYFVPAFIASTRDVKQKLGVILLNVFLGWTGLGWLAALIWAAVGETWTEAKNKEVDYTRLAAAMRAPAPPPRA